MPLGKGPQLSDAIKKSFLLAEAAAQRNGVGMWAFVSKEAYDKEAPAKFRQQRDAVGLGEQESQEF